MTSTEITVGVAVGRKERARDFTYFVQKANEYRAAISIMEADRRVNAKSLLGVMALQLEDGMKVTLTADGPDEAEAVDALAALLV